MVDSERVKAVVVGHAVGDALGVPVEGFKRTELDESPITDMEGYGSYFMPKGSWSDDTSMSLATLDGLANGIDYEDIMQKFCAWYTQAKYTPTGLVFDIGNTTRAALKKYINQSMLRSSLPTTPATECGGKEENDNGNGSLMRIHPVVLYLADKDMPLEKKMEIIENISALTHTHQRSKTACGIYAFILWELLKNPTKTAVSVGLQKAAEYYKNASEVGVFARIFRDDFAQTDRAEIKSFGYVVATLEASLWCVLTTDSYKECVLRAVNLGSDTDSVAAVAGGLAGAIYGYAAIPQKWKDDLIALDYIENLCNAFAKGTKEKKMENHWDKTWERFCEEHKKHFLKDEGTVQNITEKIFAQYFGYNWLDEEIDTHRSVQIGSTERVIPDIILRNVTEDKDLCIVELKRFSAPYQDKYEKQLLSYMHILSVKVGVLICNAIYVYVLENEVSKRIKLDIKIRNKQGEKFVELFHRNNFNFQAVKKFVGEGNAMEDGVAKLKAELQSLNVMDLVKAHFAERYPQSVVNVVLDNFEVYVDVKKATPTTEEPVKMLVMTDSDGTESIQNWIKRVLNYLLGKGKLSQEEIARLHSLEYCKEMFGLQFPLLIDKPSEIMVAGYARYYKKPLSRYYVCSQWWKANFPMHEKKIRLWLKLVCPDYEKNGLDRGGIIKN